MKNREEREIDFENTDKDMIVAEILSLLGYGELKSKYLEIRESDDYLEKIKEFFQYIKESYKARLIQFKDRDSHSIKYFFIAGVKKSWKEDSPCLILNPCDPDSSFKDNPIKNYEIEYSSMEKRDEDYDMLINMLK